MRAARQVWKLRSAIVCEYEAACLPPCGCNRVTANSQAHRKAVVPSWPDFSREPSHLPLPRLLTLPQTNSPWTPGRFAWHSACDSLQPPDSVARRLCCHSFVVVRQRSPAAIIAAPAKELRSLRPLQVRAALEQALWAELVDALSPGWAGGGKSHGRSGEDQIERRRIVPGSGVGAWGLTVIAVAHGNACACFSAHPLPSNNAATAAATIADSGQRLVTAKPIPGENEIDLMLPAAIRFGMLCRVLPPIENRWNRYEAVRSGMSLPSLSRFLPISS